ncbi:Uncharacterised protein [Mycobacteroides abscessus subsp. abscessus]|nr:Uncharacterised protein [Mycobacteroides abscessus subsp. abscessus]
MLERPCRAGAVHARLYLIGDEGYSQRRRRPAQRLAPPRGRRYHAALAEDELGDQ